MCLPKMIRLGPEVSCPHRHSRTFAYTHRTANVDWLGMLCPCCGHISWQGWRYSGLQTRRLRSWMGQKMTGTVSFPQCKAMIALSNLQPVPVNIWSVCLNPPYNKGRKSHSYILSIARKSPEEFFFLSFVFSKPKISLSPNMNYS